MIENGFGCLGDKKGPLPEFDFGSGLALAAVPSANDSCTNEKVQPFAGPQGSANLQSEGAATRLPAAALREERVKKFKSALRPAWQRPDKFTTDIVGYLHN